MATFDLTQRKVLEEATRLQGRRVVDLGEVELTNEGVRLAHNLGAKPTQWHIAPLTRNGVSVLNWWFYQAPDAKYLYLKASGTGRFLITVAGG